MIPSDVRQRRHESANKNVKATGAAEIRCSGTARAFRADLHSHRSLAFALRDDQLFKEHWTPELAASGYEFAGFENKNDQIVLYGVEISCGFTYRISIAFPHELVDDLGKIKAHFQRQYEEALARRKQMDGADLAQDEISD
jgi:hypothetical protein